jgi:hypothetical protein
VKGSCVEKNMLLLPVAMAVVELLVSLDEGDPPPMSIRILSIVSNSTAPSDCTSTSPEPVEISALPASSIRSVRLGLQSR